ncbi:MAG: recombinase family protein [Acidimicrobiia bacterium]
MTQAAPKIKVRAALYCRISQDTEGDELGVKRQQRDCEKLAARKGWTITDTYVDNDVSAFSGRRRPEYERLLSDLEAGALDAVIAYHADRLHRSPVELERFIGLVDARAIKVATVAAGEIDLSTATGRMTARIVGSMARAESERTSERIKRKKLELAERGVPAGGQRAFGYLADGMTIDKREAKYMREAAKDLLAGGSLTGIARRWNEADLRPARAAQWQASTVRNVLTSPRHAGLRAHRGEIVGDAAWPAIIDRKTHERLVALLTDPERRRKNPPSRSMLTGMIYCERCGGLLVRDQSHGLAVFRCRRSPVAPNNCQSNMIAADDLEELVTNDVLNVLDSPQFVRSIRRQDRANASADDDVSEVVEIEAKLSELAEMWSADEITRREWVAARKPLENRLRAAQGRLAKRTGTEAVEGLAGTKGLRRRWGSLEPDRRRAAVAAVVDRVVIVPRGEKRRGFDEDRVRIEWRA